MRMEMTTKLDGSASVRHRAVFIDEETLKREEWNRRRLLRLEQVRQQSKDIASLVRQKVQIERDKQLGLVRERVEAKRQQQQVRKLRALRVEYENTLQNVGKSHTEAAKQPNEELTRAAEVARIVDAAQRRGQKALACLKEEEAARRKADELRRALQQQVRALEDSRSAAIVSLPVPESSVRPKSPPPKRTVSVSVPLTKTLGSMSVLQEHKGEVPAWPKKSWPQSVLPLGVSSPHEKQGDSLTTRGDKNVAAGDAVVNPMSSPGSPAVGDLHPNIKSKIRPSSEDSSRISRTSHISSEALVPSTEVKLYDHRNLYQNQYNEPRSLAEKIECVGDFDARQFAEKESSITSCQKSNLTVTQREKERSHQALQRVKVQRDYKQLMTNLSALAKQNATVCSLKASLRTTETNEEERKMVIAIENLLQGSDFEVNNAALHTISETENAAVHSSYLDTPDGTLLVSKLDETPGSVPKLNVGRAEATLSISPATPTGATPAVTNTNTRNSSLTSLLQRINHERNILLHPQEVQESPSEILEKQHLEQSKQQQEVKILAEKIQQQHQQLKEQHTEVQRLDASIRMPECWKGIHGNAQNVCNVQSSYVPQESIVLEASGSENLSDLPTQLSHDSIEIGCSSRDVSQTERSDEQIVVTQDKQRKKKKRDVKKEHKKKLASPVKDSVVYSMDMSLSSLIVDHSASSTSGSQSVSVHGVQVLVKVCGADEESALSGSMDSSMDLFSKGKEHTKPSQENLAKLSSLGRPKMPPHSPPKAVIRKRKLRKKEIHGALVKASDKNVSKHNEEKLGKNVVREDLKKKSVLDQQTPSKVKCNRVESIEDSHPLRKSKAENKNKILKRDTPHSQPQEEPTSASTSYFSPPERVLSSLTKDIQALIAITQGSTPARDHHGKETFYQNSILSKYINKLLCMSRESIDKLHIDCSGVSTPPSDIFHSSGAENGAEINQDQLILSEASPNNISEKLKPCQFPDTVDRALAIHGSVDDESDVHLSQRSADRFSHPVNEQSTLSNLTKQCHDKISALNKMIEEVRRQEALEPCSNHDDDRGINFESPQPLDSTAYMSPPPQVLEWTDLAFPKLGQDESNDKNVSDPYASAVMQLLADVRAEMASQPSEPREVETATSTAQQEQEKKIHMQSECFQPRPRPPVAFWRNVDRCNMTSPLEPHELSTIPELGATLPDSTGSTNADPPSPVPAVSPNRDPGTPPDVIAELLRRNILTSPFSWAKKLYKEPSANQQPMLSSNSSSYTSLKNSKESELSSAYSGTGKSDISTSKETNTISFKSQMSSSNSSCDWKTNILLSPVDLFSSADEVEGDFRRLGIGWVGAMLRKTKEAGALSSSSSSEEAAVRAVGKPSVDDTNELKDISDIADDDLVLSGSMAPLLYHGRGHSTPVKQPSGSNSSSSLSGVG